MDLGQPINRESVVHIVLGRIKDALISGELQPGARLPSELELARKMGVGRTSVREAMKMLQALGVTEVRHGHGTYVVEAPSTEAIDPLIFSLILQPGSSEELVELRLLFETGYTRLAIEKMTDEDLGVIEKALKDHERAVTAGEQEVFSDLELAFHTAILNATKNPFVIKIGRTVLELFKHSIQETTRLVPQRALEDHRRIFAALRERDPERAAEAVYKSFEVWRERVQKRRQMREEEVS